MEEEQSLAMNKLDSLIDGCRRRDPRAQRELYDKLAPGMLAVCQRYMTSFAASGIAPATTGQPIFTIPAFSTATSA